MASIGKPLAHARMARDLTQTELARRAGISRQALGAIESGVYHPSVAIALRLARELGASVESLFGEIDDETSTLVDASWFDDERLRPALGQSRVALARVGGKVVAVAQPAAHLTLVPAAGMVQRARRRRADVATFQLPDEIDSTTPDGGMRSGGRDSGGLARAPAVAGSRGGPFVLESRSFAGISRWPRARGRSASPGSKERRVQHGANQPRFGPSPFDGRELCPVGIGACDGAWQPARDPGVRRPGEIRSENREPRRWLGSTLSSRPGAWRARPPARAHRGISVRSRRPSRSRGCNRGGAGGRRSDYQAGRRCLRTAFSYRIATSATTW